MRRQLKESPRWREQADARQFVRPIEQLSRLRVAEATQRAKLKRSLFRCSRPRSVQRKRPRRLTLRREKAGAPAGTASGQCTE